MGHGGGEGNHQERMEEGRVEEERWNGKMRGVQGEERRGREGMRGREERKEGGEGDKKIGGGESEEERRRRRGQERGGGEGRGREAPAG